MAFPVNGLLTGFLEALDLHLKLSSGSGRKSSHESIVHVSADFHHYLLQLLLKMGEVLVSAGARR